MNLKYETDSSLSFESVAEVRRGAIMFELNALRTRRTSLHAEVEGVRGEVQRLQQESSRQVLECTRVKNREQQLMIESSQLAGSNGTLPEVRRQAILFELTALSTRRDNLTNNRKDVDAELHRLLAECARKESECAGIRNREEQLEQELEQLKDSSNLCQTPQAAACTNSDCVAPATVVNVQTEPQLEPAVAAIDAAFDHVPTVSEDESFEEIVIVNDAAANGSVAEAEAAWSHLHSTMNGGFEEEAPEDGSVNGDESTEEQAVSGQADSARTSSPNVSETKSPIGGTTHKPAKVQLKKMNKGREIDVTEFRQHIEAFGNRSDKRSTTFKCPVCNAASKCKKYKRHLLLHLEDKSVLPYKCPQVGCSKTFERPDYVRPHIENVHALEWTVGMMSACINQKSKKLLATSATSRSESEMVSAY